MSDIEEKFSLLNDLDNIIERGEDVLSSYYFYNIGKIIINKTYMSIPVNAILEIILENGYMTVKICNESELLFTFGIECIDLYDFIILIRGE